VIDLDVSTLLGLLAAIVGLVFAAVLLGGLFKQYLDASSEFEIQDGYSVSIGLKIEDFYWSYPLAKILFYTDKLEIEYPGNNLEIYYKEIVSVDKKKGLIDDGIEVSYSHGEILSIVVD